MARLVALEVALVAAFPASGAFAVGHIPGVVPGSVGAWWRADLPGVALPMLWIAGFALSLWLLATMLVYAWATRRGHAGLRRIVGACTAPVVRRAIDAALAVTIGTAVLSMPAVAYAAGSAPARTSTSTSVAPPVIRSGSATAGAPPPSSAVRPGPTAVPTRTTAPASTAPPVPSTTVTQATVTQATVTQATVTQATVPPVVRSGIPASPTALEPPTLRTDPDLRDRVPGPAPRTAAPAPASPVAPAPRVPVPVPVPVPAPVITVADHHVVAPGESLWSIAARKVPAADVARYWAALVAVNRATLRSGNPSLVFPGEVVQLPPAP